MNIWMESYSLQFFSFEIICAVGSAVVCSFYFRIYHMATYPSNILITDSWTVMGKLAINILVQGIFGIYVLIFIGKIPTKEIAGS